MTLHWMWKNARTFALEAGRSAVMTRSPAFGRMAPRFAREHSCCQGMDEPDFFSHSTVLERKHTFLTVSLYNGIGRVSPSKHGAVVRRNRRKLALSTFTEWREDSFGR